MNAISADVQRNGKTPEGHVEYFIKVVYKGSEWAIRKRYKHFLKLEKLLLKHNGIKINVSIPPKVWWDKYNPNTLIWRQKELQKYLSALLQSTNPSENSLVREFLEVDVNHLARQQSLTFRELIKEDRLKAIVDNFKKSTIQIPDTTAINRRIASTKGKDKTWSSKQSPKESSIKSSKQSSKQSPLLRRNTFVHGQNTQRDSIGSIASTGDNNNILRRTASYTPGHGNGHDKSSSPASYGNTGILSRSFRRSSERLRSSSTESQSTVTSMRASVFSNVMSADSTNHHNSHSMSYSSSYNGSSSSSRHRINTSLLYPSSASYIIDGWPEPIVSSNEWDANNEDVGNLQLPRPVPNTAANPNQPPIQSPMPSNPNGDAYVLGTLCNLPSDDLVKFLLSKAETLRLEHERGIGVYVFQALIAYGDSNSSSNSNSNRSSSSKSSNTNSDANTNHRTGEYENDNENRLGQQEANDPFFGVVRYLNRAGVFTDTRKSGCSRLASTQQSGRRDGESMPSGDGVEVRSGDGDGSICSSKGGDIISSGSDNDGSSSAVIDSSHCSDNGNGSSSSDGGGSGAAESDDVYRRWGAVVFGSLDDTNKKTPAKRAPNVR